MGSVYPIIPQTNYLWKQKFIDAFIKWLSMYDWDWWATFTFRTDKSPEGAKKAFLRFIRKIKQNVYFFLAIEWHKWRDSTHCHSLIGNVAEIRRLDVMDAWYEKYGIARIYAYDNNLGAKYYLTKYIFKEMADWDFNLPKKNYSKISQNMLQLQLNYD